MSRIAARLIHRTNASTSTPSNYYFRNVCLSFLDYLIEGLNTRFDKYGSMIHKMHAFFPSVIGMGKVERDYKIKETIHEYRDDLPTPRNAFEERSMWERRWKAVPKKNLPDSVAKVLKVCGMGSYRFVSIRIQMYMCW